jgi:predicted RNase H-like HicB family nuclease
MFTEYVGKAMRRAEYEQIEDGTFCATIPGFEGVLGTGGTIEECREDLRGALEGWLILGLWRNDESLPKLGNLDLVPRKLVAANRKNESATAPRARKAS